MDNIISEARSMNQNTFLNHIFDTSEEAKAEVQQVLVDLREDIKTLEYQLRAMTQSRNEFQSKNAEMIKQLTYWKRRAEKAEKALETK